MSPTGLSSILRAAAGFCGLILVLVALLLLGADLVASLEASGQLVASRLGTVWAAAAPNELIWFTNWADGHLPGTLANAAEGFLSIYAWLVTGLAGVLLGCLTGPHRHK